MSNVGTWWWSESGGYRTSGDGHLIPARREVDREDAPLQVGDGADHGVVRPVVEDLGLVGAAAPGHNVAPVLPCVRVWGGMHKGRGGGISVSATVEHKEDAPASASGKQQLSLPPARLPRANTDNRKYTP